MELERDFSEAFLNSFCNKPVAAAGGSDTDGRRGDPTRKRRKEGSQELRTIIKEELMDQCAAAVVVAVGRRHFGREACGEAWHISSSGFLKSGRPPGLDTLLDSARIKRCWGRWWRDGRM